MGERETGPGRTDAPLAAAETAIVEILASWGATADPWSAAVLDGLAERRIRPAEDPGHPLAFLGLLHERARAVLTTGVAEEIGQVLETAARPGAASTTPAARSKLDALLARADGEVARHIEQARAALASELGAWAPSIDPDEVARVLQAIFVSETAETVPARVGVADDLRRAQEILRAARRDLVDGIRRELSSNEGPSSDADVVQRARAALESGRPDDVARARQLVDRLRAAADRRSSEQKLAAARASIAALCERGRRAIQEDSHGLAADAVTIEAVERAEAALEASADASRREENAAHCATLAARESALVAVLEHGAARAGDERQAREARSGALLRDVEGLAARDATPETAAAVGALRAAAPVGGRRFYEAHLDVLRIFRRIEERTEREVSESGKGLRSRQKQLVALLERCAHDLPTEQVVKARLCLDQVEPALASRKIEQIGALERALAEHAERIEHLSALVERRRRGREQTRREVLQAEAAALLEVATGKSASRLRSLVAEANRADPKQLGRLHDQLDRMSGAVGRMVRLRAGRTLYAAERWLRGKGNRAGAKGEETRPLVEAMRSAMTADDLPAMRRSAGELRARLREVSWLARPAARVALAAVPVAALAAAYFALRPGPVTYTFRLEPPARDRVRLALLHDGKFMTVDYAEPDGGSARLLPGGYEIFVNDRFTGRVIRVPQDATEVNEIPFPPEQDRIE